MKKEQSKVNKTEEIKKQLDDSAYRMGHLIKHFDHPSCNPKIVAVMREVKAYIDAAMALNEEGATQLMTPEERGAFGEGQPEDLEKQQSRAIAVVPGGSDGV